MANFSLRQVTSVVAQVDAAPLYRVVNTITDAVGASLAVFVYKTATQAFVHYATAADTEAWPDNYAEALSNSLAFYRLVAVTRDWTSLADMYADLALTLQRVQFLANELTAQVGTVTTDVTTEIVGA